ncbi:Molybdopterin binding motif, CinA N-terminal domain / C-terminal domain of CinA type S [hydrothermal vent metagenome]|uniref:Molybdopterin binding motif, CinA N-terminal domain / C-terminal domain of CinA type S n=1 Tax=hydrothermal vent metagenome TaxID=652676 RepID=A0A3B0SPN2_9ZZZZ
MFPDEILRLANQALASARKGKHMIAVAESCTGGLLSAALTAVEGSSDTFDCGFTTYSYKAKSSLLGVPQGMLVEHGAVSEQVASLMAEGALAGSTADIAVAITGIAGPGGGTEEKPVGLVCFAVAQIGFKTKTIERVFDDKGRAAIRMDSVKEALTLLCNSL